MTPSHPREYEEAGPFLLPMGSHLPQQPFCWSLLPPPHPVRHRIPKTDPVSDLCGFAQVWKGFWARGRQPGFRNVLQTGAIRAFTSRTEGGGRNFKKVGWGRWGLDGICSRAALKHSAFFETTYFVIIALASGPLSFNLICLTLNSWNRFSLPWTPSSWLVECSWMLPKKGI